MGALNAPIQTADKVPRMSDVKLSFRSNFMIVARHKKGSRNPREPFVICIHAEEARVAATGVGAGVD
jgi:hypothetical protein